MLFTWNLFSLQSSKFSFEYLLLSSRSALRVVRFEIAFRASSSIFTFVYSSRSRVCLDDEIWVARLSVIHFQNQFIRSMNCYALFNEFRLSWSSFDCSNELTSFVMFNERAFRHLNFAFDSFRIVSSAYQKWLISNDAFARFRSSKQQKLLTYWKFENRLKVFYSQDL